MKRKTRRIDGHSHVLPKEMLDALTARPDRFQMRYISDGKHRRVAREGGGRQPAFDRGEDRPIAMIGKVKRLTAK